MTLYNGAASGKILWSFGSSVQGRVVNIPLGADSLFALPSSHRLYFRYVLSAANVNIVGDGSFRRVLFFIALERGNSFFLPMDKEG